MFVDLTSSPTVYGDLFTKEIVDSHLAKFALTRRTIDIIKQRVMNNELNIYELGRILAYYEELLGNSKEDLTYV
jgi:hypothetical protein